LLVVPTLPRPVSQWSTPSGSIFVHGAALHRKCLLIVRRNTAGEASAERVRRFPLRQKTICDLMQFGVFQRPVLRPFRSVTSSWPQTIPSSHTTRRGLGKARLIPCPQRYSLVDRYYCFDFESGPIDSSIRLPALRTTRLARIPDRSV